MTQLNCLACPSNFGWYAVVVRSITTKYPQPNKNSLLMSYGPVSAN